MNPKRKLNSRNRRLSKGRLNAKRGNFGRTSNAKSDERLTKVHHITRKAPKLPIPIPIKFECIWIENFGIDYDFQQEDVRVHRDLVK